MPSHCLAKLAVLSKKMIVNYLSHSYKDFPVVVKQDFIKLLSLFWIT